MLKERTFTEDQKKRKCKVAINYDEMREMTIEELIKFMKELEEGKHPQYDIPILFRIEKLNQEFRETVVSNKNNFSEFLSYLYCAYRKIEKKMSKNGYPDILPDPSSVEKSFVKICSNLDKAKQDYQLMNRNDFLEIYPVVKKLFFCYIDYIRYSLDHVDEIDEGKYLPGTTDEMEVWLQTLNTWFPIEISKKWINCVDSLIAIPSSYKRVAEALHNTAKFSNTQVVNNDEIPEPYIAEENNKKILFGFVDMEKAKADKTFDNSTLLELECPEYSSSIEDLFQAYENQGDQETRFFNIIECFLKDISRCSISQ